jgi:hypothetical protein
VIGVMLLACAGSASDTAVDPCTTTDALSPCLSPTETAEYYADVSSRYFDTMDYTVDAEPMPYGELVARWEWPPWLKLTGYTAEGIESSDALLTLFPSVVSERDCRGFDEQPFGRCRVTFYYDSHDGKGCPIYEEFVFNDAGAITWIEAWSDQPGLLPMDGDADGWAEGAGVTRLSSRIPGLGNADGLIDLDSQAMALAEAADEDVADFATRARDFGGTWLDELGNAPDDMWDVGCGW